MGSSTAIFETYCDQRNCQDFGHIIQHNFGPCALVVVAFECFKSWVEFAGSVFSIAHNTQKAFCPYLAIFEAAH